MSFIGCFSSKEMTPRVPLAKADGDVHEIRVVQAADLREADKAVLVDIGRDNADRVHVRGEQHLLPAPFLRQIRLPSASVVMSSIYAPAMPAMVSRTASSRPDGPNAPPTSFHKSKTLLIRRPPPSSSRNARAAARTASQSAFAATEDGEWIYVPEAAAHTRTPARLPVNASGIRTAGSTGLGLPRDAAPDARRRAAARTALRRKWSRRP